jgi:drug/metabolite transporter (DMT)-like permease
MPPSSLLGIGFALTAAVMWGSGDFSGGLATRRSHQYQVLLLVSVFGMVLLFACAVAWGEGVPTASSTMWGALAGAAGSLGVAALYKALSLGNTASVAPTSAIITAALPVLVGSLTEGLPKATQMAGFALAFAGIWLVSRSPQAGERAFRQGMALAFLSGIGFGGFFICLAQVEPGQIFAPIFIARSVSLVIAWLMLRGMRLPLPGLWSNPVAILAGVLDTAGNVFFLLATQLTRLDVAAVLGSLYPAATVVLATVVLKEKVRLVQWAGAALCLVAIVFITF